MDSPAVRLGDEKTHLVGENERKFDLVRYLGIPTTAQDERTRATSRNGGDETEGRHCCRRLRLVTREVPVGPRKRGPKMGPRKHSRPPRLPARRTVLYCMRVRPPPSPSLSNGVKLRNHPQARPLRLPQVVTMAPYPPRPRTGQAISTSNLEFPKRWAGIMAKADIILNSSWQPVMLVSISLSLQPNIGIV